MALLSNPMGALAYVNRASGLTGAAPVSRPGFLDRLIRGSNDGEGGGGEGGGGEGGGGSNSGGCSGCSDTPKVIEKHCENEGGLDAFCDITYEGCVDGSCEQWAECAPASECCEGAGNGGSNLATCIAGTLAG